MPFIHYIHDEAHIDGVSLLSVAEKFGTPSYVYSRRALEDNYRAFEKGLQREGNARQQHLICYAVKANSNLSLLHLLAQCGAGFDIVSEGELARVLAAGGDPRKIVFSGVGKRASEIKRALQANIFCFNVESAAELDRIHTIAKEQNQQACISLRLNPDIDAMTHPYIATGLKNNKFGIDLQAFRALLPTIKNMPHVRLIGLACHIGSQCVSLDPFIKVMECLRGLYLELKAAGIPLEYLNLGGGLGVRYHRETPPSREDYVAAICRTFAADPVNIIIEPGRSLVADIGVLISRIEYLKETPEKNFAIMDAGMNDFMRPALYQAWQDIIPVVQRPLLEVHTYDIVGPICESADFLGTHRRLRIQAEDVLAILMAGAYGFCMSSQYNSRPRPAEILIDNNVARLIRQRETVADVFALEKELLCFTPNLCSR